MPPTAPDNPTHKITAAEVIHAIIALAGAAWLGFTATQAGVTWGFTTFWCTGLIALAVTSRFPAVGLWVFVALTYGMPRYNDTFMTMSELGVQNWACTITALGFIIWMVQGRRRPWVVGPMTWIMVGLVAWLIVTIAAAALRGEPWKPHPNHHPQQYLQAMVMFWVASRVMIGPTHAYRFALVTCITLCVRAILAGSQGIYLENDISALAVMAMPLAILGFSASRRWGIRACFVLLLVGLIVVLSLTYNRAAAVGFIVLLVVLWGVSRYKWRALAAAAPLLIVAGVLFASSHYWQRFAGIWKHNDDRLSVDSRIQTWQAGWQMFVHHPVTGVGSGNFHHLVQDYGPLVTKSRPAHNNFVEMLAEAGAPGLVLYVFLFFGTMATLWRTASIADRDWPGPGAKMLIACVAVYLTIGCFMSRQDMVLAYILAGWAAAMHAELLGLDDPSTSCSPKPILTSAPTRN